MTSKELNSVLLGFIEEIRKVHAGEPAKKLQDQIEAFYKNNDVPPEKDVLAQSGFCEMLSMLAD